MGRRDVRKYFIVGRSELLRAGDMAKGMNLDVYEIFLSYKNKGNVFLYIFVSLHIGFRFKSRPPDKP